MFVTITLFILGFVILVGGASILVDGSSSIAKKYNISNLVIGLTIIAFGTSAPELVISVLASARDSTGIALGNIIGSNISNTLLILGVAALIRPLFVKRNTISKEIPFSVLALVAVAVLANDILINSEAQNSLLRSDGMILILFFLIFIYYTFSIRKEKMIILENITEEKIKEYGIMRSVGLILLGLVFLYFGGHWIVNGAVLIAKTFSFSESFIALTVIAVGTSLPELVTSAVAAYKGHADMAIGNIIGSNIFNLLMILGISAIVHPIVHDLSLNVDMAVLGFSTILLIFLVYFGRKNVLARGEGAILLFLYICYIIFLILRN